MKGKHISKKTARKLKQSSSKQSSISQLMDLIARTDITWQRREEARAELRQQLKYL